VRIRSPFLVLLAGLAVAECGRRAGVPEAAATPVATSAPAASPASEKLVGRWLRADSNYVIEVAKASPDGEVEARYFNPKPIHVSRAVWKTDGQKVVLFVEMQDQGYPGNYYELAYDPGSDALVGRYNHLGLNETFDVAFSRVSGLSAP